MIRRTLKHLPLPLNTVIEYGPGNGVMTKVLLKRLSPNGKFLAVESNAMFAKTLTQFNDPRLHILHGNAQHLTAKIMREFSNADAILSSIPFTFLTSVDRFKIVSDAHSMLASSGTFNIFHQYTPLMVHPLRKIFRSVKIKYEMRNVFPCFILIAEK